MKASVLRQIKEGKTLLSTSDENSEALALIIDGKSLTYALEDDVKDLFLELAVGCASVICCRSSPKQKALVSFPCYFISLLLYNPSLYSQLSFFIYEFKLHKIFFVLVIYYYYDDDDDDIVTPTGLLEIK